jgi:hypothetical protein
MDAGIAWFPSPGGAALTVTELMERRDSDDVVVTALRITPRAAQRLARLLTPRTGVATLQLRSVRSDTVDLGLLSFVKGGSDSWCCHVQPMELENVQRSWAGDGGDLWVMSRIRVGTEPTGLAIDGKRNTAYVTNFQDDTVAYFATPK